MLLLLLLLLLLILLFLQAFFLVADDIMDGSETRRGQPCWYKREDIGMAAFNDSILLETAVYSVLREHFGQQPGYLQLLELLLHSTKVLLLTRRIILASSSILPPAPALLLFLFPGDGPRPGPGPELCLRVH